MQNGKSYHESLLKLTAYAPMTKIIEFLLFGKLTHCVNSQNVVLVVQIIVAWAIPDVPHKLNEQIEREQCFILDIIIDHERKQHPRNMNGSNPNRSGKIHEHFLQVQRLLFTFARKMAVVKLISAK